MALTYNKLNLFYYTLIKFIRKQLSQYDVILFSPNMKLCRLQFQVQAHTIYGQQVYVSGNIPELGNWNPQKALKLYTDQKMFPQWKLRTQFIVVREETKLDFKLAIVNHQKKYIRWENIPNRSIVVKFHSSVIFTENNQNIDLKFLGVFQKRKLTQILQELDSDGSNRQQWQMRQKTDSDVTLFYHKTLSCFRKMKQSHKQSDTQLHSKSSLQPHYRQYPFSDLEVSYRLQNYCIVVDNEQILGEKKINSTELNISEVYQKSNYFINQNFVNIKIQQFIKQMSQQIEKSAAIFQLITIHIFFKGEKVTNLQKILKFNLNCKIVLYIPKEYPKYILKLCNKLSIIVLEDIDSLNKFVDDLKNQGYFSKMVKLKRALFNLYHSNYKETLIYCSEKHHQQSRQNMTNKDCTDNKMINELLLSRRLYAQNSVTIKKIKDKLVQQQKRLGSIIIIIAMNNVRQISQKVCHQLMKISSQKKHQIYIIHNQSLSGIEKVLPNQQSNNLIVLNPEGQLYSSLQLTGSLYQSIKLSTDQLRQYLKQILQSINDKIHCKARYINEHCLLCCFSSNSFGDKVRLFVTQMISNKNRNSLHKLAIIQKGNNQILIKPLWLLPSFFIHTILDNSLKQPNPSKCILAIDLQSNQGILNLIQRNLQSYLSENIQYQGLLCQQNHNTLTNTVRPTIATNSLETVLETLIVI